LSYLDKNIENTNFIYIKNETNKWKGFSLKEWFKRANWDFFIIQDADLEYDPNDYKKLIKKSEDENLDFVYGSRTRWHLKSWFKYSYLTFFFWWLLVSIWCSIFTLKCITDEPTCYKIFRKNSKEFLIFPKENWFEYEPAITVYLLKKWFSYWETDIKYFPRKKQDWKKIKWTDWIKALWIIIKRRFFR
jgi:hypothetical protein